MAEKQIYPRYSAPDLTEAQQKKAREGSPPWPKNRDIDLDAEDPASQGE